MNGINSAFIHVFLQYLHYILKHLFIVGHKTGSYFYTKSTLFKRYTFVVIVSK